MSPAARTREGAAPAPRFRLPVLAPVLGGLAVLTAVACFSEDPEPMGPLPADCRQLAVAAGFDPDDSDVEVVGIRDFAFVPAQVTVAAGTRVVWVNCEPQGTTGGIHTSTADDDTWDSPLLSRGQTFERVFDEVGAFDYHCAPHPFMQGTVTVGGA